MPRIALVLGALLAGPAFLPAAEPQARRPRTDSFGDPLPPGAVARLGTLRWKGGERMSALTFSPDGKLLAAASGDGMVRVWAYPGGVPLRAFPVENSDQTVALVFTPDGKRLLLAGPPPTVARVLDLTTGRAAVFGRPGRNGEPPRSTVFSKDGRWALCFNGDGERDRVTFTDLADPRHSRDLGVVATGGDAGVFRAAVSRDGRWVAFSTPADANPARPSARVWLIDTATGRAAPGPAFPCEGHVHLLFSPDSSSLVVGAPGRLARYEVRPGKEQRDGPKVTHAATYPPPSIPLPLEVECVVFSPDGNQLIAADGSGLVLVWDAATGKLQRSWAAMSVNTITGLAVAPDGKALAVTSDLDAAVRFFDPATGRELLPRTGHRGPVTALAFHPSGKVLASTSAGDGSLRTWDLTPTRTTGRDARGPFVEERIRGREYAAVQTPGLTAVHVAFGGRGRLLVGGCAAGGLFVWDTSKRSGPRHLDAEGAEQRDLIVSPAGDVIALALAEAGICWIDARTGEKLKAQPAVAEPVQEMFFSPDGATFGVVTDAGRLLHFDVVTGKERRPRAALGGVAERYAACFLEAEQAVIVRDRFGGRLVRTFEQAYPPFSLSPDGRFLAATVGNHARLFEVASGLHVLDWDNCPAQPRAMQFSPDGSLLAAGYPDGTILLWDCRFRVKADPNRLAAAWAELANEGTPADGLEARDRLAASPKEAVALLKEKLKPAPPVDPRLLADLLADLNHPRFAVREKATRRLEAMAGRIEDTLERARGWADAEAERRLERVLASTRLPVTGEALRVVRAVEVLERIGTPEARELLTRLADGEGAPAREARDALERLRGGR